MAQSCFVQTCDQVITGMTLCSKIFIFTICTYTNSLVNATFGSGIKIVLTKFCVKQGKWNQFHDTSWNKMHVSEGISV